MPELELFFSPGACSRVSLIALEETGAAFTASPVLLSRGEQKAPAYLRLNPKGKVPLLLRDGQPLTENIAIVTALSRHFPQARLLPTGHPDLEIDALSLLAWFASGLHPLVTRLCLPQVISDAPGTAPRIQAMAADMLGKHLALLEQRLGDGEWFFDHWTVVDAYAFWVWSRLDGAPIDRTGLTRLARHAGRVAGRPAVVRALAREAEAAGARA